MKGIKVYDSGDKFADRYTVVIDKDIYGMSSNAASPQGVNMYVATLGEINDSRGVKATLDNSAHGRGRKLRWSEVPEGVKRGIEVRIHQMVEA